MALCVVATLALGCGGGSLQMPWDRSPEPSSRPTSRPTDTASAPGGGVPNVERGTLPGIVGEPEVRIRINRGVNRVRVDLANAPAGARTIWVTTAGSRRPPARMVAPVEARLSGPGWELTDASGLVGRFDRDGELRMGVVDVAPATLAGTPSVPLASPRGTAAGAASTGATTGRHASMGPMLVLDGRRYTGIVALTPRSDLGLTAFDVIEQVGVEEYLKGVVSAEMFRTWPLAAFEMQAIAARSYALHERQRARLAGQAFDLEASTADQAYDGTSDNPVAAQAVINTRGIVLTWQGRVLRAYYSSTSGGRPASAKDTWPIGAGFEYNLAGPLQAQPRAEMSQSSPFYRWTVNRSRNELARRLSEWGRINGHDVRHLRSIDGVRTVATNDVGRPTRFEVRSQGRSFFLSSEELRRACNQEVSGLESIVRANRVNSGDMEWSILGDVVTIRGRGFGHGVGMCQYSAKELAERGQTWRSMITIFYPGARVERVY